MRAYRVHVHDYNDGPGKGTWLASADFRRRPGRADIAAALPLLFEPGRYEVRLNLLSGDDEIAGWGWLQDAAPVRVIFRRWYRKSDGTGVIALFPDLAEHDGMCVSYEHIGQHGAASLAGVISRTRPAKPDEYAALQRELEAGPRGYVLAVIERSPRDPSAFNKQVRSDSGA